MDPYLMVVFLGIGFPFTAANHGQAFYRGGIRSYIRSGANDGVEEIINESSRNPQTDASVTATADIFSPPSAQPSSDQTNAQLPALHADTNFHNFKKSDSIAERKAEKNSNANMRQGKIGIVAPNTVRQTTSRSLLVPNDLNNNEVLASQALPPIVINQPGSSAVRVKSGPPAIVRVAPVIYKLKPSIVYQQEVINKVPSSLSLTPVYVKVYKPGKHIDAGDILPSEDKHSFGSNS